MTGCYSYEGDSKLDRTKLQAMNIVKAARSYYIKNGSSTKGLDLEALVTGPRPFLEGGKEAITTSYGEPFVLEIAPEKEGILQVEVYFKTPDGRTYDSKGNRR
jgi:hypothetical protein